MAASATLIAQVENEYTFQEIRKHAKRAGVKIYAQCRVTSDDVIMVEVVKSDFLRQISEWDGDDFADQCSMVDDTIQIG